MTFLSASGSTSAKKNRPVIVLFAGSQKGGVLIMCLVFLLAMTLMTTVGTESAVLEERMVANRQDYTLAFHAADAALHVAEAWLLDAQQLPVASADGTSGVWYRGGPTGVAEQDWWRIAPADLSEWWQSNATALLLAMPEQSDVQAAYALEELSMQPVETEAGQLQLTRARYRITARATGNRPATRVVLQSQLWIEYAGEADESGRITAATMLQRSWRYPN